MTKGKLYGSQNSDHAIVHLGLNVSSSTHNCGCVVGGGNAMAAISVLLLFIIYRHNAICDALFSTSRSTALGPHKEYPCSNEAHKATCTQVHNRELTRAIISSHVINRGKRLNFHCQGLRHTFFTLSHPKQGYFVAAEYFPLINIYKPSFIASTCICSHEWQNKRI